MANWLADKLNRRRDETQGIPLDTLRQIRRLDPNNLANSLNRQTSRLSGGSTAGQGVIAEKITQSSSQRSSVRSAPRGQTRSYRPPPAQSYNPGITQGQAPSVKTPGGGIASTSRRLIRKYVNTKLVGNQLLEITTLVYLVGSSNYVVETKTRVLGQGNIQTPD